MALLMGIGTFLRRIGMVGEKGKKLLMDIENVGDLLCMDDQCSNVTAGAFRFETIPRIV